jgi:hypothetical protein
LKLTSLFTNLTLPLFCSILHIHIVNPTPGPAILPRGEYNNKFLESRGARTLSYTRARFNSYTVIMHLHIHTYTYVRIKSYT